MRARASPGARGRRCSRQCWLRSWRCRARVLPPAADPDPTRLLDALVTAGGGPGDFKTLTLIGVLAGANANDEVASLTRRYGRRPSKTFVTMFDEFVADALRLAEEERSPASAPSPVPAEADGGPAVHHALCGGLRAANRNLSGSTAARQHRFRAAARAAEQRNERGSRQRCDGDISSDLAAIHDRPCRCAPPLTARRGGI